jgi:hypothetical protein
MIASRLTSTQATDQELAMIAVHRLLAALIVSAALAACGSESEPPQTPPAPKDTIAGDMARSMDKARAVEDTAMQHKEDLDRSLDAAENNH